MKDAIKCSTCKGWGGEPDENEEWDECGTCAGVGWLNMSPPKTLGEFFQFIHALDVSYYPPDDYIDGLLAVFQGSDCKVDFDWQDILAAYLGVDHEHWWSFDGDYSVECRIPTVNAMTEKFKDDSEYHVFRSNHKPNYAPLGLDKYLRQKVMFSDKCLAVM